MFFCFLSGIKGKPSEPVALYLYLTTRTWNEAHYHCQEEGRRLVTVKDVKKRLILQNFLKAQSHKYVNLF